MFSLHPILPSVTTFRPRSPSRGIHREEHGAPPGHRGTSELDVEKDQRMDHENKWIMKISDNYLKIG